VRDCVVSRAGLRLDELPAGSVLGTSSLRRAAQVKARWPRLETRSIRGNVDTRIHKVRAGEFDAILLAAAGIRRLGLEAEVTEWLPTGSMLPAPAQGALAVQCRADDEEALSLLSSIDDPHARATTGAERSFLRELAAGCTAPVGAYAEVVDLPLVRLDALVMSPDGRDVVQVAGEGDPEDVGTRVARMALDSGADRILAAIRG
jgi:hydroxymethylbilane synthase